MSNTNIDLKVVTLAMPPNIVNPPKDHTLVDIQSAQVTRQVAAGILRAAADELDPPRLDVMDVEGYMAQGTA